MMGTADYDVLLKVVVIGDSGVGKSCLLHRYSEDAFSPAYIATIGVDFNIDTFERDGKIVKLHLWDTAGQERFRTIAGYYYRGAHCVMLCYDVTDPASFASVRSWIQDVRKVKEDVPMLLVGTKKDMARQVPRDEAETFAAENGMQYVETSARDEDGNVHEAVRKAVSMSLDERVTCIVNETSERKRRLRMHTYDDTVPVNRPKSCFERFRGILRL